MISENLIQDLNIELTEVKNKNDLMNVKSKFLGKKGKELAYSNSKFERLLDKFGATFRPRSKKSQELFEGQMRVTGEEGAAAIVAKDLVKDIDDSFKKIFNKSKFISRRMC